MHPILPSIISSFAEVIITQPLDVIKTYAQTNQKIKSYNFQTLYKGFIPRSIGNIPSRSTFLFTQDYLKQYIPNNRQPLIIPIATGFAQTLIDTPVEVAKINKIFNLKSSSIISYYSGFVPHCTRNIIFIGCVFNMKSYAEKYNPTANIIVQTTFGAIGGVIGSYLSHPFDTIKTLIQTSSPNNLVKIRDYFRGSHLRAGMGFINMFISLTMFEFLKKY
jgi:hypothetical protein